MLDLAVGAHSAWGMVGVGMQIIDRRISPRKEKDYRSLEFRRQDGVNTVKYVGKLEF